jgi:hypothetical protein
MSGRHEEIVTYRGKALRIAKAVFSSRRVRVKRSWRPMRNPAACSSEKRIAVGDGMGRDRSVRGTVQRRAKGKRTPPGEKNAGPAEAIRGVVKRRIPCDSQRRRKPPLTNQEPTRRECS